MEIKKVKKDGNIAVLVAHGYGAGWSTRMDYDQASILLFHPDIVNLVQENRHSEITEELCNKILGDNSSVYVGGATDLKIEWVPEGVQFKINGCDGYETLLPIYEKIYYIA